MAERAKRKKAAPRGRGGAEPILEVLAALAQGSGEVARLEPGRFPGALRPIAAALNQAVERVQGDANEAALRLAAVSQGVDEAQD